jgi:multiple sugar transport system permease protein
MKMLTQRQGDRLFSLGLLLPTALMTFIFILVPVIDSVRKSFLSFRMRNIISGEPGKWNNFANYIANFQNGRLLPAIGITFSFVVMVVLMQFVFGMILAMALNSKVKGARLLRSVMMAPWVVPTVISALIWMWIFQPQYGLLKFFVQVFTGGRVKDFAMLNNPNTALLGIAIAALWKQIPLTTLLLLAGLQNVPQDVLEAATVDGAGAARRFFSIVMPYMKSVVSVTLSIAIIENFKQFPLVWTMTGGGPSESTTTLAVLSYREAFVSSNFGQGAAVTTIWLLIMMIVVWIYNRLMKQESME